MNLKELSDRSAEAESKALGNARQGVNALDAFVAFGEAIQAQGALLRAIVEHLNISEAGEPDQPEE